jgi:hypothetical protein
VESFRCEMDRLVFDEYPEERGLKELYFGHRS